MSRKFLTSLVASLFALSFAGLASAQTTINTNWNGSGNFNFNAAVSNGANQVFTSGGYLNQGNITFVNQQDNPYSYGVSTVTSDVSAKVTGVSNAPGLSGFVNTFTRDASFAPMYGSGVSSIQTYANTSDGVAEMATHDSANYAALGQVNYGQARTSGGQTLQVSGSYYEFGQALNTGVSSGVMPASSPSTTPTALPSGASIQGVGNGTAQFATNASTVSGNSWTLGSGAGIYTLASYSATGAGQVSVGGQSGNQITGFGATFNGSSVMQFGGTYANGGVIPNWSMQGN